MFFSPRSAGKKLHLSSITNSQYDAHRDNVVIGSGVGSRSRNVRSAMCRRSASSTCRCTVKTSDNADSNIGSSVGVVVKGYVNGSTIKVYAVKDMLPLVMPLTEITDIQTTTNEFGVFSLPKMTLASDISMILVESSGGTDIAIGADATNHMALIRVNDGNYPTQFAINATTTALANGTLYSLTNMVDVNGNQEEAITLTQLYADKKKNFQNNTGLNNTTNILEDYIVYNNIQLAHNSIAVTTIINMAHAFNPVGGINGDTRVSAELNTARVLTTCRGY